MQFKDFLKELKGIKYKSDKDWEILLPYSCKTETIQKIIGICRDNLLVTWHLHIPEPTEECPEPDIRMYWDNHI